MIKMIALMLVWLFALTSAVPVPDEKWTVVPEDYFGLHCNYCSKPNIYGIRTTPFPSVGQKAMRLWDSGVTWRAIEQTRGNYDWRRLDQLIAINERNNLETMLTLGQAPDYCATGNGTGSQYNSNPPTDDAAGDACWIAYVSAVSGRYGSRIKYYTLWNEPDSGYWNGTVVQLVRLAKIAYPILKKNCPHSIILSPDFLAVDEGAPKRKASLVQYLDANGGPYMDAVAIHAYPRDAQPEASLELLKNSRLALDRHQLERLPMYDTENGAQGWFDARGVKRNKPPYAKRHVDWLPSAARVNKSVVNVESGYVTRQYLIGLSTGLLRQSYYYSYDNPDGTQDTASVMAVGMIAYPSSPSQLRPPGQAYRYIANLLPGGSVSGIKYVNAHYELNFRTRFHTHGTIYWTRSYETSTVTPTGIINITDNVGTQIPFRGSLTITGQPVFVFKR